MDMAAEGEDQVISWGDHFLKASNFFVRTGDELGSVQTLFGRSCSRILAGLLGYGRGIHYL